MSIFLLLNQSFKSRAADGEADGRCSDESRLYLRYQPPSRFLSPLVVSVTALNVSGPQGALERLIRQQHVDV